MREKTGKPWETCWSLLIRHTQIVFLDFLHYLHHSEKVSAPKTPFSFHFFICSVLCVSRGHSLAKTTNKIAKQYRATSRFSQNKIVLRPTCCEDNTYYRLDKQVGLSDSILIEYYGPRFISLIISQKNKENLEVIDQLSTSNALVLCNSNPWK